MSSYISQNTKCVLLFWTVGFRGKYAYIQANKSLFPQYESIKPRGRLYRNAKSAPTCLVLLDRTCRVLDFASSFYDKHRPYASAVYWADQTPIHGLRVVTDFMSSCQDSQVTSLEYASDFIRDPLHQRTVDTNSLPTHGFTAHLSVLELPRPRFRRLQIRPP